MGRVMKAKEFRFRQNWKSNKLLVGCVTLIHFLSTSLFKNMYEEFPMCLLTVQGVSQTGVNRTNKNPDLEEFAYSFPCEINNIILISLQ